jgi:hypothetical protein
MYVMYFMMNKKSYNTPTNGVGIKEPFGVEIKDEM